MTGYKTNYHEGVSYIAENICRNNMKIYIQIVFFYPSDSVHGVVTRKKINK